MKKSSKKESIGQTIFKNVFWGLPVVFAFYNVGYFMYLYNFVAPRNFGIGFMIFTNAWILGIFINKYISLWKNKK
jgi:hypothetical protein